MKFRNLFVVILSVLATSAMAGDLKLSLRTDKAIYNPGDKVVLSIEGDCPSGAKIRIHQLDNVINEAEVKGSVVYWTVPQNDFTGYLAEVLVNQEGKEEVYASVGIDVSSSWAKFPRYGFVDTYDASKTSKGIAEAVDFMNRCHINGVQFYDWQWKHQWPLAGTRDNPMETYTDIANRTVLSSVVKNYIEVLHQRGMKCMFYNLCYGALEDAASDGVSNLWYVYKDKSHSQKDSHSLPDSWKSDIFLVNPGNVNWQKFLADRNDDVYANFDFDGFHIDQLGSRGNRYDYWGQPVDMAKGYASFINAMKKRHPDKSLVMNAVSSFGIDEIAKTGQVEFNYEELWDSQDKFEVLRTRVQNNRVSSKGKNTVFAAYMNYGYKGAEFNTPGILLTDATMFALGGSHLELGDHMLCSEYFPNTRLSMSDELKQAIVNYYDFLVAYENLLRGDFTETATSVQATNGAFAINRWPPQLKKVTAYTTKVGTRNVVHLLNYKNTNNLSWRDYDGTQNEPDLFVDIPLKVKVSGVGKVWVASPDVDGGLPKEIGFVENNGEVSFTLPSLKYWTMIVFENAATMHDDDPTDRGILVSEEMLGVGDQFEVGNLKYTITDATTNPKSVLVAGLSSNAGTVRSLDVPKEVTYGEESYQVVAIGEKAFMQNIRLTTVNMTDASALASIEPYAFNGCSRLATVYFPPNLRSIGSHAFCRAVLNSLSLPAGLQTIGDRAFERNNVDYVNIPANSRLTEIQEGTFNNNDKLKDVVIPANIIKIGNSAFNDCAVLSSIYFLASTCPKIGDKVFGNAPTSLRYYISPSASAGFSGWANVVGASKVQTTFPLTLTQGWSTFCRPFAVDFSNASNMEVYYVSGAKNGVLALSETSSAPANSGLVIYAPTNGTYSLKISDASSGGIEGNLLVGLPNDTYVYTTNPSDNTKSNYGLSNGSFVEFSSDALLRHWTAYLSADNSEASSKVFTFNIHPDGIKHLNISRHHSDNLIFNLSGQRVDKAARGIFIINGNKVRIP